MATFTHNNVDITIRERNGSTKIVVPWLPATIEYKNGEQVVASYDILNRGEVKIPTGTGLATINWNSQFPGRNRDRSSKKVYPLNRVAWRDPSYYDKIMKRWIQNGTALNVTVTGYPINLDVHLSSYEATMGGGFGDIEYTVEFTEDRDLEVSSTKVKKKVRWSKKDTTYKVKKGDTIWKIAKKTTGDGSNWIMVYDANKKIIESTAKKHGKKSSQKGKYIYAGTKLRIPGKGTYKMVGKGHL